MQSIVEVNFLDLKENKDYIKLIEKVIDKCFEEEKLKDLNIYMSITLTTEEQIHKLNKEYRNVDKPTDVLSFPMFEKEEIDSIIKNREKRLVNEPLGDIIISIKQVELQAKEYGHSFERELSYMLVHGFYHLMGYDHIEEKDKIIMRPKEEKILQDLKITRE